MELVRFDILEKGKTLAVSFTGLLNMAGGIPVLEFKRTLEKIGYSALFVTDMTKQWYNNPIVFEQIKNKINEAISSHDRVIFLGFCMGGFGAILFSSVCHCDAVIAFGPQIEMVNWDTRCIEYWDKIPNKTYSALEFSDKVKYYVYWGVGDEFDVRHAELIPMQDNIHLFPIKDSGHNVASFLKEEGRLVDIIKVS